MAEAIHKQAVPYPNTKYAWYVTSLLGLVFILAYVDRYILSLLIQPIKTSLDLTDFQIGLLIGPAFVVLFVTIGLPIGWLVDRKRRTIIITTGIAVWSIMTAACGLASSFATLFLARVGVGIGETTVSPCAISLIADYFPKESRPRAIALFMLGAPAGAGVTYIIGGQVVEMIAAAPPLVLPLVGELFAWQTAFLLVGLPGLVAAFVLWLTVREPHRQERLHDAAAGPTLSDAVSYIRANRAAYFAVLVGAASNTGIAVISFWTPALYERTWGWGVGQSGLMIGGILIVGGLIGTLGSGWIAARLIARGVHHAPYYTVLGGSLLLAPFAMLYPLMPSAELASVMLFFAIIGTSASAATSPSCIIAITPGELRGLATAMFYFAVNLLGALIAPPVVGIVTDWMGAPEDLKYAMVIVAFGFSIVMLGVLVFGLASFKRSAAERAAAG